MRAILAALFIALPCAGAAQESWLGFYPEGPIWLGSDLYWAEMESGTVMRLNDGTPEPFIEHRTCGPTALAPYGDEEIIVLCHLSGRLLRVSRTGAKIAEVIAAQDGTRLRNPNDASPDGQGGIWFTDPGRFSADAPAEGRLYHLSADGVLGLRAENLAYGNGVHLDLDRQRVLVSEHLARRVISFPLLEDGAVGPPEVLVDLDSFDLPKPRYPEAGPDGLELGPDGTLWIAEYGTKRLLGWREDHGLVAALEVDAPYITNIAFSSEGQAVITGAYTNHEPRNRGGIWLFDSQVLVDAARSD